MDFKQLCMRYCSQVLNLLFPGPQVQPGQVFAVHQLENGGLSSQVLVDLGAINLCVFKDTVSKSPVTSLTISSTVIQYFHYLLIQSVLMPFEPDGPSKLPR